MAVRSHLHACERMEERSKRFSTKQVEAYAVQEEAEWLVITVIVRYF